MHRLVFALKLMKSYLKLTLILHSWVGFLLTCSFISISLNFILLHLCKLTLKNFCNIKTPLCSIVRKLSYLAWGELVSFAYLLTPLSIYLFSNGNWKSRCYKVIASSFMLFSPTTSICPISAMTFDFHIILLNQLRLWSLRIPLEHLRIFQQASSYAFRIH